MSPVTLVNEYFQGAQQNFNPFIRGNLASHVLRHLDLYGRKKTMSAFHLTSKQIDILTNIDSWHPERLLSALADDQCLNSYDLASHVRIKCCDDTGYQYHLFKSTLMTEQDYINLNKHIQNLPTSQISFTDILFFLSKHQSERNAD